MILFKATADPDTMCYHQAMKEPDAHQYKRAMQDEIDAHAKNKNWKIIKKLNYQPVHESFQHYGR